MTRLATMCRAWLIAGLCGLGIDLAPAYGGPGGRSATSAISLEWTTPGDDDKIGVAYQYDLRYSLEPITLQNFFRSTIVVEVPRPGRPGHKEKVKVRGLEPDRMYYFALRTVDESGNWSGLSNVAGRTSPDPETAPALFPIAMSAPFPNPARARLEFELSLPRDTDVFIEAFDVLGRRVKTVVNRLVPAGVSPVYWDLRDRAGVLLQPGTYWLEGRLGARRVAQRFTVLP